MCVCVQASSAIDGRVNDGGLSLCLCIRLRVPPPWCTGNFPIPEAETASVVLHSSFGRYDLSRLPVLGYCFIVC